MNTYLEMLRNSPFCILINTLTKLGLALGNLSILFWFISSMKMEKFSILMNTYVVSHCTCLCIYLVWVTRWSMNVMYVANCIALDGAHKSELFMVEHTFSSFDFCP